MVNISIAGASFHHAFARAQANRHQEGRAMKGDRWPSIGLPTSKKMLHNYTLIPRDGTRRVDEGSAYQVRRMFYRREGTARWTSLLQGQKYSRLLAFTQAFTAGKGRLWRQEGGGHSRVGSDVNSCVNKKGWHRENTGDRIGRDMECKADPIHQPGKDMVERRHERANETIYDR